MTLHFTITDQTFQVLSPDTNTTSTLYKTTLKINNKDAKIDINLSSIYDQNIDTDSLITVTWKSKDITLPQPWSKTLITLWNFSEYDQKSFDCNNFVAGVLTGAKDMDWYLCDTPCDASKQSEWPEFSPVELLLTSDTRKREHVSLHLSNGLFLSKYGTFSCFLFQVICIWWKYLIFRHTSN